MRPCNSLGVRVADSRVGVVPVLLSCGWALELGAWAVKWSSLSSQLSL